MFLRPFVSKKLPLSLTLRNRNIKKCYALFPMRVGKKEAAKRRWKLAVGGASAAGAKQNPRMRPAKDLAALAATAGNALP